VIAVWPCLSIKVCLLTLRFAALTPVADEGNMHVSVADSDKQAEPTGDPCQGKEVERC
jgi:hypothetical protein